MASRGSGRGSIQEEYAKFMAILGFLFGLSPVMGFSSLGMLFAFLAGVLALFMILRSARREGIGVGLARVIGIGGLSFGVMYGMMWGIGNVWLTPANLRSILPTDSLPTAAAVVATERPSATPTVVPTPSPAPSPAPTAVPTTAPTAAPAWTAAVFNGGNVRSEPGLSGQVLDQIHARETVDLRAKNPDGSWYQITNARQVTGWVSATLLTVDGATAAAVPVAP